ncbi:molybdopterin-dependent oxidoreductase [Candidatus Bathyarchaeota archaeon]|nr:molybdopterin-dependent oxidoreductase [Candidatus Bathyarchaeota archaeon]
MPTGCAHDCGGKCLLYMEVEDNRVASIRDGGLINPTARSLRLRACGRGLSYNGRLYHPERLTKPLIRAGVRGSASFKAVPWGEALDLAASRLEWIKEEYGCSSILNMGGSGSYPAVLHDTRRLTSRFLNMLGGCIELYGSYSNEAAKIASIYTYGTEATDHPRCDLLNSKLIIMWGWNPLETFFGSDTINYLREAKDKGCRIICIDPRRTPSARFADAWIPIRPGTDVALASAMAYTIIKEELYDRGFVERFVVGFREYSNYILGFEDGQPKTAEWASTITGVPAPIIVELARSYAREKPAALMPGWGPQRTAYGEQFIRATSALASITGNIGISGGNPAGAGVGQGPTRSDVSLPTGNNPVGFKVPVYQWIELILKGVKGGFPADVKALYAVGSNYLNQQGNSNKAARSLKKLDLIIAHEHFLTSTARYADIVFPAAMYPERNDILLPWSGQGCFVIYQAKIVDPLPEAKTDLEIFTELAERLGFAEKYNPYTEEEWLRRFAEKLGIRDYEEFKREGIHRLPEREKIPFRRQIEYGEPFQTPSGKIELYSKKLAELDDPETPPIPKYLPSWEGVGDPLRGKYPLQLLTPKNIRRIHSSTPGVSLTEKGLNRIWINPRDAGDRGISPGDVVKVFNDRGILIAEAYVTEDIIEGVVSLEEGAWYNPDEAGIDRGGCPNTLTSDKPTPLAKAATTHTTLVQVTRHRTS